MGTTDTQQSDGKNGRGAQNTCKRHTLELGEITGRANNGQKA